MSYLIAILLFIFDQVTKKKASKNLSKKKSVKKLNGLISLQLVHNKGAFMGFLKNNKKALNVVTVLMVAVIAILSFPLMIVKNINFKNLGFSLVLGGALSNGYDRLAKGKVVDFFSFLSGHKVYFNFADIGVISGAILLMLFG